MRRQFIKLIFLLVFIGVPYSVKAWEDMAMPKLRVDGNQLKDTHGNVVILHGYAQTFSPWFNEQGAYWTNYDVDGCLEYNKEKIDEIIDAGWKMSFVRMHMDPYWSNTPGVSTTGEDDISAFSFSRFKTYLDQVFIPMAEYAISKGMYVVMRPPGVCPDSLQVGDDYQKYLIKVWYYVSQQEELMNNPNIMFELANEPINILGTDGTYSSTSQAAFDNLKAYFQAIVDTIRVNADNILWVPGLSYQAQYAGFAINPVEGDNIGYAIHVYPGWFNSGSGYEAFQSGWDEQIQPVADIAPIMVTEMDWAEEEYDASWGHDVTGTAGGEGFGANFNKITQDAGNVSWLLFTSPEYLAAFDSSDVATTSNTTFLNDPEACPWPCYLWYLDYAEENYPRPDYTYLFNSDNGDDTYTNPIVFGDFPDPDVIRVGDVYYMSTTTMHHFSGATILKSKDLVNWEYCNNPLEKIESSDAYNLDGDDRYAHGMWASSMRYHDGTFYLHFNTLDEGSYLLSAIDPEGTWTKTKLSSSFYDAGLFFDDDDKIYIVYGIDELHISQLDAAFNVLNDQAITYGTIESGIDNSGTEGSHLYKKDGYYYIYATTGGYYKTQVAYRSTSIYGPYDEKVVFDSDGIHQGALIETQTGEWWTILFDDAGAYGRFPTLQPVTWEDNWPIVGDDGNAVSTYTKPNVGKEYAATYLPTNDVFQDYNLASQWEWNHNPDNSYWSLVEQAGYMRLYTANVTDSLHKAKNTLTQRILGFPDNDYLSYATVKMQINHMQEGDVAGLAVFQDPYALIGIRVIGGLYKLYMMSSDGDNIIGSVITDSVIYLRAVANYNTSEVTFYYSIDNDTYTQFGNVLDMQYKLSIFVGNRFCLFNYATASIGGYVDVDWFSTEKEFLEETFYDDSFEGYSEESLSLDSLSTENTDISLLTGNSKSYTITATYLDDHTEDVTLSATYINSNPDVLTIKNGQFIAKANGEAIVTVTYQGGMGDAKSVTLSISSSCFPLTEDLFDASIYETGTFDETTGGLVTGEYGFGGWEYSSGLDLSSYKYLVAQLKQTTSSSASFRVFDESSYWSTPVSNDFESTKQIVIDLQNSYKDGTTLFDPSHIYIVGIWSTGSSSIMISSVYVTNNDDYSKPSDDDPVISVTVNPLDGGTVWGTGIYSVGSSCALKATAATGYIFSNWSEDGSVVSSDTVYSFTISDSRTLVANFVASSTNCKVKVTDCSCIGSDDGEIDITLGLSHTYAIEVTGKNYDEREEYASSDYTLTDLCAGMYDIVISDNEIDDSQQEYTVVVSQPEELSTLKTTIDSRTIQYVLSGSQKYYVTVNKETSIILSDTVCIALQDGENTISIRAAKLCQGVYEESLFVDEDKTVLFPNPTDGQLDIIVPGEESVVDIEVVGLDGTLQYGKTHIVESDRVVQINISNLNIGIYFVKITNSNVNDIIKVVKK